MAFAIDASVGGAAANSFVTAAEMTAYCDGRLNASTWTGTAAQLPALAEATRDIHVVRYKGRTASTTQALAWPRFWVVDPDHGSQFYATTVIPQRVKDATCELALQYLKAGTTDVAALDATNNLARKRVDVLETEYVTPGARAKGLARYPRVWNLLRPLMDGTGPTFEVVRG